MLSQPLALTPALSRRERGPIFSVLKIRVTADQAVQVRDYLAVLPYEVLALVRAGEAGDVLKAAGRTYQILDALQGSEIWECDLLLQAMDGN